jgi:hypothetical protein
MGKCMLSFKKEKVKGKWVGIHEKKCMSFKSDELA